jgi:hypothetical protein
MGEERRSPAEETRWLYEEAESRTAEAMEELVRREGFGELLARVTENAMAMIRISQGMLDLGVRNLRLAGREDVVRLGRQLARTEDKLERVLQEVERLEARLDEGVADAGLLERSDQGNGSGGRDAGGGTRRRSGQGGKRAARGSGADAS